MEKGKEGVGEKRRERGEKQGEGKQRGEKGKKRQRQRQEDKLMRRKYQYSKSWSKIK